MKKFIAIVLLLASCLTLCSCIVDTGDGSDCVRIHIRANSNETCDQSVKLLVRDEIVGYLTPLLASCGDATEAKGVITNAIPAITAVANECLRKNAYAYTAEVVLTREKFPYRKYLDYSFPEGVYDALIVKLGKAEGDNWWCVCFPPLCFVPEGEDDENFSYKSKILEIIKKYRG